MMHINSQFIQIGDGALSFAKGLGYFTYLPLISAYTKKQYIQDP